MGVRLPEAIDYGQRPSLQSNRLDMPGTGSQESAQAILAAATEFKNILEEKQGKQDDLNYALARNEIVEADLLEREKLANDTDHATQSDRYDLGFRTAREKIAQKYPNMDPHDKAILNAEANLIGTRGGVAVRGRAREIEVDQGYAALMDGMARARENLLRATDYASRNAIIQGQLEAINAAEAAGYFGVNGAVPAEAARQKLTQDFAMASITAMSDEEQIEILSGTLAHRKGYGDNVDRDARGRDISPAATDERVRANRKAAGLPEYPPGVEPGDKGSPYQGDFTAETSAWGQSILDSQGKSASGAGPVSSADLMAGGGAKNIGDFLHADTAATMLKAALGRDKENRQSVAAQEAVAAVNSIYPEDPEAAYDHLKNLVEGSTLEKAERRQRQHIIDDKNEEIRFNKETNASFSQRLRDEDGFRVDDIALEDPTMWERMGEANKRDLYALEDSLLNGRAGFAAVTTWAQETGTVTDKDGNKSTEVKEEQSRHSWSEWESQTREWKLDQILDSAEWMSQFTPGVWAKLKEDQDDLRKPKAVTNLENIMTNPQIFTSLMGGGISGSGMLLPRTGRTPEQEETWQRELFLFQNHVGEVSKQKYGGGEVPYTERRDILLKMMGEKAWVRDASNWDELEELGWGPFTYWGGTDLRLEHPLNAMTMTPRMRKFGFIHYVKFENIETTMLVGEGDDAVKKPVTWPVYFTNYAKTHLDGYVPNRKDMENAMYAEQQNLGEAEMKRRLGGGGQY
jgi:hypothetical protein